MQFDSTEFGHIDPVRWCPVEALEAQRRFREQRNFDSPIERGSLLMFGDGGRLMLFLCLDCPDGQVALVHQCS